MQSPVLCFVEDSGSFCHRGPQQPLGQPQISTVLTAEDLKILVVWTPAVSTTEDTGSFCAEVTNSHHCRRLPLKWDAAETLQKEAPVVPSSTSNATRNLVLSLDLRAMAALHALATRCQHNSHSTHAHPANPGFIATLPTPVPQTPEPLTTHDISCRTSQRHYHFMHTCPLDPGSMATLQVFTTWKLEYC